MFTITARATTHLANLRRSKGLDEHVGVRFVKDAGRLGLVFATAPGKSDLIVADQPVPIYVSPELRDRFERSVVDATSDGDGTKLVIRASRS
jgi:Fe-S cluster assembly iron-binding protein IscA